MLFWRLICSSTRYFKRILFALSSSPFYTSQVIFPIATTPIPLAIDGHPRFQFFKDCIGAVDGTHIRAFVPERDHATMRNRKGFLSQNCLFICNFDFLFVYALTGWDGVTADAALWSTARSTDLRIPNGKYLLADAGFGISMTSMVPYRGVRYHLREWRQARLRYVCTITGHAFPGPISLLFFHSSPQNPRELFNLRHAALRNIIERIFGVMKHRWRLLQFPAEYNMDIQACIPTALCALHNFMRRYDPDEIFNPDFLDGYENEEGVNADGDMEEDINEMLAGPLADRPVNAAERRQAEFLREQIAQEMWTDYQHTLRQRGLL